MWSIVTPLPSPNRLSESQPSLRVVRVRPSPTRSTAVHVGLAWTRAPRRSGGAGGEKPCPIERQELGDESLPIDHVQLRDPLDLPTDQVTLAVTALVPTGALQQEVIRMEVQLDAPAERGDREVGPRPATVGQGEPCLLRDDRNSGATKCLAEVELAVRLSRGAFTALHQGRGDDHRPRTVRMDQPPCGGHHRGERAPTLVQDLFDDGRVVMLRQISTEIERQARRAREPDAVRTPGLDVDRVDPRRLPETYAIDRADVRPVGDGEVDRSPRPHPPQTRQLAAGRPGDEASRVSQAQLGTQGL